MIIIYCSKPQQNDAVTPTPLAHRSHTCMRALALGNDRDPSALRTQGPERAAIAGPGARKAPVPGPRL